MQAYILVREVREKTMEPGALGATKLRETVSFWWKTRQNSGKVSS